MTKYRQVYLQMVEAHTEQFSAFKVVHDGYQTERKVWSAQFHALGKPLVEIIRDWEQRLCSSMERGKFAAYSNKVSEKFWDEIRKVYPLIDRVGVKSNLD